MTSKQRLITALKNEQPDQVPVAPDFFEMIPIRLSDRPSWETFVYQDPPIWKARADAAFHFGVDAFIIDCIPQPTDAKKAVVYRSDEKIIVREIYENENGIHWSKTVMVYEPNEPSAWVRAEAIGLPETHDNYEIVKPNYTKTGKEYFDEAKEYVGEKGVFAPMVFLPCISSDQQEVLRYYDEPEAVKKEIQAAGEYMMKSAKTLLEYKPDVLLIGNSGLMIFNPPPIFRELCFEWLVKVTKLAKEYGVLTHMHCCGPEKYLVETAANETDLNGIEPLEIPPTGDCILKEIKDLFGDKIALKGNLHTTEVMLRGTPEIVETACKKAIDDAAPGGGFILSTGDQTPRDTPDETILLMKKIAETYGKY